MRAVAYFGGAIGPGGAASAALSTEEISSLRALVFSLLHSTHAPVFVDLGDMWPCLQGLPVEYVVYPDLAANILNVSCFNFYPPNDSRVERLPRILFLLGRGCLVR